MSGKKMKILIAEDEELIREVMAEAFADAGYEVIEARDAFSAIQACAAHRIDAVVSDMRMPGGGGMAVIDHLLQNGGTLPPTIMITGFSDVTNAAVLEKGALELAFKPFDPDEVVKKINRALAGKAAPSAAAPSMKRAG